MTRTRVPRQSNTVRAVADLRELIFAGELPAGSYHLESELAERLGMSRTPVREAALLLESQGLVALRPRRGVCILPVSDVDMAEIYDVLTELECLAVTTAAGRGLCSEELAPLATALREMEQALRRDDLEAWALGDDSFHRALVQLSDNSRVMAIAAMMNDQVRRARSVTLYMRPRPDGSNKDHRAVLEAILEGDATRAASVHRAHRQEAKDTLLALLKRHKLSCI